MRIVTVCKNCRYHDNDPNLEINFKEGSIYYMCPECRKENKVNLYVENKPFPKARTLNR